MKKLLFIGAGLFVFGLYAKSKISKSLKALESLKIGIAGIHNLSMDWNLLLIKANIDLALLNPTDTHIGLSSAGAITIKKIVFINKENGSVIAEAQTNITGVNIAPQSQIVIENIAVELPVLQGLLANYQMFLDKEKLHPQITVSILGKEYIIN